MTKTFEGNEFQGFYAAKAEAKAHGLTVGSMQRDCPIGLHRGLYIGKWRHYGKAEKQLLAGVITGEMRDGPVTLTIFDETDKNPYV